MQIPTNPMYDIDESGVVRLISSGSIVREYLNHHGKRAVKIRGKSHKASSHPLDRLMLSAYSPLPEDKDPEWYSVRYKNLNKDDISIKNLSWDDTWYYPSLIPGVTVDFEEWIPVYAHPQIDIKLSYKHGIMLRNSVTHQEIGKSSLHGYVMCYDPRNPSKLLRVHRLVALTFLPHPIDTDHLTINHKDSDKSNNWPSNLEWSTYTQNNSHAYLHGPRGETIRKILLRHLGTEKETLVSGFHEMARYIGISPQAAHQVMERRKFEGRPYKGFVFKYADDIRSWEEIAKSGPRKEYKKPEKIAVKNMDTQNVTIYSSFNELLEKEQIRDFMVYRLINKKPMVPWRRRCFQSVENEADLKWPKYPKEILDVYENTHSTDRPISVTYKSSFFGLYSGATAWSREDRGNRLDPAVISRYLKKSSNGSYHWRDWVISYIDLEKYSVD